MLLFSTSNCFVFEVSEYYYLLAEGTRHCVGEIYTFFVLYTILLGVY